MRGLPLCCSIQTGDKPSIDCAFSPQTFPLLDAPSYPYFCLDASFMHTVLTAVSVGEVCPSLMGLRRPMMYTSCGSGLHLPACLSSAAAAAAPPFTHTASGGNPGCTLHNN